jgi:hypothetical protein
MPLLLLTVAGVALATAKPAPAEVDPGAISSRALQVCVRTKPITRCVQPIYERCSGSGDQPDTQLQMNFCAADMARAVKAMRLDQAAHAGWSPMKIQARVKILDRQYDRQCDNDNMFAKDGSGYPMAQWLCIAKAWARSPLKR